MAEQLRKTFRLGAKVRVLASGGWQRDALGTIVGGPEPVETVQGQDFYWSVRFSRPEQDIDGDGPYSRAEVLSRYIENADAG